MGAFIDLTGQRFGRLTVIKRCGTKSNRALWLCVCDCGNDATATTSDLRRSAVTSCGCYRKELAAAKSKTAGLARGRQMLKHGKAGTRLYNIWKSMRERCNNPNDRCYKDYGGRGIQVCPEWDKYDSFHDWAMKNNYKPNATFGECTIDRINVNKGYCPDNCRWVNLKTQAGNRRSRNREAN